MFEDDDEIEGMGSSKDDLDDFAYYAEYIRALEEERVSKGFIVEELMTEFDLDKAEAVKVLKRYLAEKNDMDDDDEEEDSSESTVEDDDYGDGNNTEY